MKYIEQLLRLKGDQLSYQSHGFVSEPGSGLLVVFKATLNLNTGTVMVVIVW